MTDQPRPMRAGRRAAVAVLATALILLAATATLAASSWKARGWFDAPLPGATLPLAPYPVVLHAADDSGVAQVRWLVDGTPAEVQQVTTGGDLVTVNWVWQPASLGEHVLTAVIQGTDGSLSDPVSVGVTISADAEVQPTPELSPSFSPSATPAATGGASATSRPASATPAPTPTSRPTVAPTPIPTPIPTPCQVYSPNLTSPYVYETVFVNPPTLVWTPPETGCPASSFRIRIAEDGDFAAILVDEYLAGDTNTWTPPSPLPDTATCEYFWTVTAIDADGNESPPAETSAFTIDAVRVGC